MKIIINFILLLFAFLFTSCNYYDYKLTEKFYHDNYGILKIIKEEMFDKELYTYINIISQKKSDLKQNELEYNIVLEKRDVYSKSNFFDTTVTFSHIQTVPLKFSKILTESLTSNEIQTLNQIILFMIDKNIEAIHLKTPEFNYLTIKFNSKIVLIYQEKSNYLPNLENLKQINDFWYYATYK